MKKFVKYIAAFAASAALFASCDLNLVPNYAVAYEEDGILIQTTQNLNALENGMLSSFRALQNGGYIITSEVMMDCFNATLDFGNNWGAIHRCTENDFTATDYDVEDYWAGNYSAIKNYNIFIAASENLPEDEEIKAGVPVVKAEAHFFRAVSYLNLARHFAKAYTHSSPETDLCVPLVTVYDQQAKPGRATIKQVYDQIKADLDEAAKGLADVKGTARSTKPTIDAVNAMYARYYIDLGDNAKAAEYAHKVIDSGNYALSKTAEEMEAEYVNDNGSEPIMQCADKLNEGGTNSTEVFTYYRSDDKNGKVFRPYYLPTKTVIDSYEPSDLRLAAWFDNTEYVLLDSKYFKGDFYVFSKYWGNPALTSSLRNGRTSPKPFKIGEMYLIAAEAELKTNPSAAKTDLNALQTARGAVATDANETTVRQEWLKETIGEGLRMVTLKRWGIGYSGRPMQPGAADVLNAGTDYEQKQLPATAIYFCWPIPAHEMNVNPGLKGQQNPGYENN